VLALTDTVTGEFIAQLPNLGGGKYGGSGIFRFSPSTRVTVTSNLRRAFDEFRSDDEIGYFRPKKVRKAV
jgi:hypothetical protein